MPILYILVNIPPYFYSKVEYEPYALVIFLLNAWGFLRNYQYLIPYAKKIMLQTRKRPILELSKDIRRPDDCGLATSLFWVLQGPQGIPTSWNMLQLSHL